MKICINAKFYINEIHHIRLIEIIILLSKVISRIGQLSKHKQFISRKLFSVFRFEMYSVGKSTEVPFTINACF